METGHSCFKWVEFRSGRKENIKGNSREETGKSYKIRNLRKLRKSIELKIQEN